MRDVGADETDKIIIEIENRIKKEYTQAEREIKEKLDDYLKRFEIKDKTWRKWVAEGKKTAAEYKTWRTGQIAIGERWEEMRQTIAEDLLNTSKIARSIANGYMPEVYALNYDYGTYQVETGSLIDTSYTLYNREAAERIFRENPKMLPAPGKKVSKAIKDKKAIRWNNSHIQSVMMQALVQGNSIPDIATRLANAVGDSDRKAAVRNARTMATGAQNAGRVDAYSRAGKMGLKVRKQWLAILDLRTRHEHRMLDGQIVDNDKPFDVDGDKIMFPGDPSAKGYLLYNCRCRLMAAIEGHERDLSDPNLRSRSALAGMSYEEWKQEKKSKSNSILLPEEKGENIRAKYIREYRGYGGPVASGRDTTLNIDRDDFSASFAPSKGNAASPSYKDAKGALPLQDTMSKTAYDQYARQLRNAGDDIINLHDKYDYSTGFINVDIQKDSGDACYSRSSRTVKYTLKDNRSGDRFQWLNHECGHMYDDKIDGSIKDMTFEEFSKIREAAGWNGYSQPDTPSRSDEFMSAMRKDIEKLWDVVSAPNWETLNSELLLDDASSGVQDFLDGVFGKSQAVKTIWGHGESYYNRMYESLGKSGYIQEIAKALDYDEETLKDVLREYETSSELWANICSALTGGGNAEKYMRMYAPESLKAFLSIIRRI